MEIDKKTLNRIFLRLIGILAIIWLFMDTKRLTDIYQTICHLLAPFAQGACIAFVFNVPMRGVERQLEGIRKDGLRRGIALLLTLGLIILVVVFVVEMLVPQMQQTIQTLSAKIPQFVQNVGAYLQDFLSRHEDLNTWIATYTDLQQIDWATVIQKTLTFVGDSATTIMGGAVSAISSVTGAVVNTFIALAFAVYCLFRKEILARQGRRLLYALFPEGFSDGAVRILRLTNATFSKFISGQCLEACILGCLFAVAMAIFRLPYIALVSVVIAVTALVPVVGAFVGCVIGAFFILVDSPIQAVFFVAMFLIIQQLENNLIYPRVVGTSIGLPGMWVLMAVTIGGDLMGVTGMLLMIPLASVVYTLIGEYTGKRLKDRNIPPEKLVDQPPERDTARGKRQTQARKDRFAAFHKNFFRKK